MELNIKDKCRKFLQEVRLDAADIRVTLELKDNADNEAYEKVQALCLKLTDYLAEN